MREEFKRYLENTIRIRSLSVPKVRDAVGVDEYGVLFQDDYLAIAELAEENSRILNEELFPYLKEDERLGEDIRRELSEFADAFSDIVNMDDADPFLHLKISEKLLNECRRCGGSADELVMQLDRVVSCAYTVVTMTNRIVNKPELSDRYRDMGIDNANELLSFLEHEKFKSLKTAESRRILMIDSRYVMLLYSGKHTDDAEREYILDMLKKSLKLSEDPFYTEFMPDYDWKIHRFGCYFYFGMLLGRRNDLGFNEKQLEQIYRYALEMEKLWYEDPVRYSDVMVERDIRFSLACAKHEAGYITGDTFRRELLQLYDNRKSASEEEVMANYLKIPVKYLYSLNKDEMTEEEKYVSERLYRNTLNYANTVAGSEMQGELLDHLTDQLRRFIEIPGCISFAEMGLGCLAALHPPTFVHSYMVAQISRCIGGHLLKNDPAVFGKLKGLNDPIEILDFIYNAALCHDLGKVMLTDLLMIYGRERTGEEEELIREHAELGAYLLSQHESTAGYANVARYHMRWYNGEGGYPAGDDPDSLPEKTVIDIVHIADVLDMATDDTGSPDRKEISFDECIEEMKKGAGTRYAPWVAELFDTDGLRKDIDHVLNTGRRLNYVSVYRRLRRLTEQSVLYGDEV